jgi:hypothetical protein
MPWSLHPKDPAHYLKVPNLVAAERIAEAVLEKYELRDNLRSVLERLEIDGDIRPVLRCYRDLMVQRDACEEIITLSAYCNGFRVSVIPKDGLQPAFWINLPFAGAFRGKTLSP